MSTVCASERATSTNALGRDLAPRGPLVQILLVAEELQVLGIPDSGLRLAAEPGRALQAAGEDPMAPRLLRRRMAPRLLRRRYRLTSHLPRRSALSTSTHTMSILIIILVRLVLLVLVLILRYDYYY